MGSLPHQLADGNMFRHKELQMRKSFFVVRTVGMEPIFQQRRAPLPITFGIGLHLVGWAMLGQTERCLQTNLHARPSERGGNGCLREQSRNDKPTEPFFSLDYITLCIDQNTRQSTIFDFKDVVQCSSFSLVD